MLTVFSHLCLPSIYSVGEMPFCGFFSFSNRIVYLHFGLESFLKYIKGHLQILLGVRDFNVQILGGRKHSVHNTSDDQGPVAPLTFPHGLWNLEPIDRYMGSQRT